MVAKAHRQNKTFPTRCWDWQSLFCLAWLGLWQYEFSYGLFPFREFSPFYFSLGYRSDYFRWWFSIAGDYVANCATLPGKSGSIPFLQSLVSAG